MNRARVFFLLGTALVAAASLGAQPSHPEVLIVYNSNVADSLAVASHYQTARNIPAANLCAISPSDPGGITFTEYFNTIRPAIQSCLNTVGKSSILYIVMCYMTPYDVVGFGPGYALDSYIQDIWDKYTTQVAWSVPSSVHGYYANSQAQGDVYLPFVPFATWRATPRGYLIYSVFRLDAPSAALAQGLVDKAMNAEAAGGLCPNGQCSGSTFNACFDHYHGFPENSNPAQDLPDTAFDGINGDWDLARAADFLRGAAFPVTENVVGYEPGGGATCNNAAIYSGWYSLGTYSGAFNWIPNGAIGYHMDSESALSPRSGSWWVPNAISAGITVTVGAVNEPFLAGFPRAGGFFRNLLEGANVGDAMLRNTRWLKWMILNIGDPLYKPFPQGPAPGAIPISLTLNPMEVVGAYRTSTATVILNPAPTSSVNVSISPGASLSAPPSVTVPAGATQASFTVSSSVVTTYFGPILVVDAGAPYGKAANTLTLDPLLQGLTLSPRSVTGGSPVNGQVFLNDRAPVAGITVTLSSSNPAVASVPASVKVPAGLAVGGFTITTSSVSSSTQVTITASYAGVNAQAILTVN